MPFLTQVPTSPPGVSGLSFGGGKYTYSWQTDAAWANTCREFVLTLTDRQLAQRVLQLQMSHTSER